MAVNSDRGTAPLAFNFALRPIDTKLPVTNAADFSVMRAFYELLIWKKQEDMLSEAKADQLGVEWRYLKIQLRLHQAKDVLSASRFYPGLQCHQEMM